MIFLPILDLRMGCVFADIPQEFPAQGAFAFSLRRSIGLINASIENKPGPNTRTITAVSRNGNGSALTNLSGSLMMLDTASKSAAR
jgi:hypothetical protein